MMERDNEPILFSWKRRNPWRLFSNLGVAPMIIDGKEYQSVEHYFQSCKATTDWEHEMVRLTPSPAEAKRVGRQIRLRPDWGAAKIDVMRNGLLAKFRQHDELRALLLSTGQRELHEDSANDAEWSWQNGTGRDLLGQLMMEVREILTEEVSR